MAQRLIEELIIKVESKAKQETWDKAIDVFEKKFVEMYVTNTAASGAKKDIAYALKEAKEKDLT